MKGISTAKNKVFMFSEKMFIWDWFTGVLGYLGKILIPLLFDHKHMKVFYTTMTLH